MAQSLHRLAGVEAERDSNIQILESAAEELAVAQQELAQSQQEAGAAAEALSVLERQQERSRAAIMEVVATESALRNQLTQSEERMASMDREAQRLQDESAIASSQEQAFGSQRGQFALEFESVSQKVAGLTTEISRVRQSLESKRSEEAEAEEPIGRLARGIRFGNRKERVAGSGDGRARIFDGISAAAFQSGGLHGGLAPAGVLADFL